MPSKQIDRDGILNSRPITLLNTDYKLIAIIYALRLNRKHTSKVDKLIKNVPLTQDIIKKWLMIMTYWVAPSSPIGKTHNDQVDCEYLEMCLKRFGFGTKFHKC